MNTFRKLGILMLIVFVTVFAMGMHHPAHKTQAQGETLTIWHSWQDAEAELLDTWVANFTEANPDITIETRFIPFDDLRSTYENAGTEGPDLLIGQADWAGGLSEAGLILPIDDLVADTDLDTQVTEAAWGTMSYDGSRYGTPITLDGVALYYNRDIIADEDVPTTLEELFEVGAELTEGDDVGLLFNNGFYHSAGIYFALGGQLFDEEGNNMWNTDEAAETYLAIHQMAFSEAPELVSGDNALFQEGRAAMIVDGVWNLNTYTEKLGDSLGVALLPEVDGEPWSPFVGGKGFYVNSQSENTDAAVAFLTYVTSAEGLALGAEMAGHVPTGEGVEVDNPNIAKFAEQFALGTPLPTAPEMGAYWEPLGAAITAVTEGGADPADAAAEAEATILEKLTPVEDGEGETEGEGETSGEMPATIIEAATAAGNFTALLTAVEAAGLTEMLMGEGPYTVFAPSDEVFAALPPGTLEAVLADPEMLMSILQNHVVEGEILAADLAGMTTLTTVAGGELTVTVGENGTVTLNGDTNVVMTDIMTGNGVIHVIDGVLVP
jgi:arabinogalactan oligomer / maltooligosaccharide transport system substrate-binding protein